MITSKRFGYLACSVDSYSHQTVGTLHAELEVQVRMRGISRRRGSMQESVTGHYVAYTNLVTYQLALAFGNQCPIDLELGQAKSFNLMWLLTTPKHTLPLHLRGEL